MAPPAWVAFMTSARMMSLCFLVVQNTSLVLVMRHVRSRKDHEMFLASTAVVCDEMMKFSVCCAMVALELSAVIDEKPLSLWSKFRRTVINQEGASMAVPALLYALQKNLLYVALSNLDASVYQVAYQGKILTTALFSYLMLHTPLTKRKLAALFSLATGVALVELAKMDRGSAAHQEQHNGQNPGRGFMAVAMACCTSGFASVFFEYKLKQRKPDDQKQAVSVWVRNLQLSFFTGLLALSTVALKDGQEVLEGGFFQGYDELVCLTILLEAGGGLLVGLVIKYADNIAKIFAMALSLTSITALSALVGDFEVTASFVMGATLTVLATYLYSVAPARVEATKEPRITPVPRDEQPSESPPDMSPLSAKLRRGGAGDKAWATSQAMEV